MTGFSKVDFLCDGCRYTLEIMSLNSRFLDISVFICSGSLELEHKIRSAIASKVRRGKVRVSLRRVSESRAIGNEFLSTIAKIYDSVVELSRDRRWVTPSVGDILSVLPYYTANYDEGLNWECLNCVVERAVDALWESQLKEGERLVEDIAERLDRIERMVERINVAYHEWYEGRKLELRQKAELLLGDGLGGSDMVVNVLTELLGKGDVTEEIVRLGSHVKRFKGMLGLDSPIGKDMNFVLQEMLREINTIGSKSGSARIVDLVVDVKSELERIREQLQNIL